MLVMCFSLEGVVAQTSSRQEAVKRPRLVIGIVVDQMRWDYLYRYNDRFCDGGFKRLMKRGHSCENTFIPYTPTYTAPGHASIYTGSFPSINGIIGNFWYSKPLGRTYYCTEDSLARTIGSNSVAGQMSPRNMWSNTIGDELRLATNFRSKVIGVAMKDRGAILPAGHAANGAYWYDSTFGGFVSSSFYMKVLPAWAQEFNNRRLADKYLEQSWDLLYSQSTYINSTADSMSFEAGIPGEDNSFPHLITATTKNKYHALRYTPFGNTLTTDMAIAAIEGEGLGKDEVTDMLAVSYSSSDYIGHEFGPNSLEVEDMYLRLDIELAAFLKYLDKHFGKDYLVFLTADHGCTHNPDFLVSHHLPGGSKTDGITRDYINKAVEIKLGLKNAVSRVINYQVYLNNGVVTETERNGVIKLIIDSLLSQPHVANAFELKKLNEVVLPLVIKNRIINGYNQKLSGDIQMVYKPGWYNGWAKGTTHGLWNSYDAHIPLIWYGVGISPGRTTSETYMTDIAATLAAMLKIQMPNGCVGQVISEVMK